MIGKNISNYLRNKWISNEFSDSKKKEGDFICKYNNSSHSRASIIRLYISLYIGMSFVNWFVIERFASVQRCSWQGWSGVQGASCTWNCANPRNRVPPDNKTIRIPVEKGQCQYLESCNESPLGMRAWAHSTKASSEAGFCKRPTDENL